MRCDDHIDAMGLLCPLPVLKLGKRLREAPAGSIVALHADDPAAVIDVPHFCNESGHELLGQEPYGAGTTYFVRKMPAQG